MTVMKELIISMITFSLIAFSIGVRPCEEGESQCSPNAPFTCLEGPSKFGCHPQENFWPTHGCTEQCQTPGSDPTTSDRGFNIFNKSQQPLYIGVLGHNPLPNGNNGFLLLPGESRLVIPEPSFSGRIWARTGCKRVQMIGVPYFFANASLCGLFVWKCT